MDTVYRRLPVYLLLDCSGSMSGEPIEAVRQGVKALLADLRSDPQALETAYLSVITFSSSARQVCPLTELMIFREPALDAQGSTSMGEALTLLERCIENEVRKSTPTQKGDWKPLVFLMTDGQPTDNWEAPADRIRQKERCNIIACAAGSGADSALLKRTAGIVVELNNLQPDTLKAFFKWVSISIRSTSLNVAQAGDTKPLNLPPPPPEVQMVP
ncbi:MAG: VWA domain-containing protein [Candidatus Xenobiia bacterium LiM19]